LTQEDARIQKINAASLTTLLLQPQFYTLYVMNILSIMHGLFIVGSSMSWGQQVHIHEGFLNSVAQYASIFGALRFFWSMLLDKYNYRLVYGVLLTFQIMIGATLPLIT